MPTISEIQKYLIRHQRPEEDAINSKTEERVTRQAAEQIKKINPLPKGRCNACGIEAERLVPATMNVCIGCCNKFIKKAELRIVKKEVKEIFCDFCLARTFIAFYINPLLCQHCSRIIGRTHKYGRKETRANSQKIEKEKYKRGMKL